MRDCGSGEAEEKPKKKPELDGKPGVKLEAVYWGRQIKE